MSSSSSMIRLSSLTTQSFKDLKSYVNAIKNSILDINYIDILWEKFFAGELVNKTILDRLPSDEDNLVHNMVISTLKTVVDVKALMSPYKIYTGESTNNVDNLRHEFFEGNLINFTILSKLPQWESDKIRKYFMEAIPIRILKVLQKTYYMVISEKSYYYVEEMISVIVYHNAKRTREDIFRGLKLLKDSFLRQIQFRDWESKFVDDDCLEIYGNNYDANFTYYHRGYQKICQDAGITDHRYYNKKGTSLHRYTPIDMGHYNYREQLLACASKIQELTNYVDVNIKEKNPFKCNITNFIKNVRSHIKDNNMSNCVSIINDLEKYASLKIAGKNESECESMINRLIRLVESMILDNDNRKLNCLPTIQKLHSYIDEYFQGTYVDKSDNMYNFGKMLETLWQIKNSPCIKNKSHINVVIPKPKPLIYKPEVNMNDDFASKLSPNPSLYNQSPITIITHK